MLTPSLAELHTREHLYELLGQFSRHRCSGNHTVADTREVVLLRQGVLM